MKTTKKLLSLVIAALMVLVLVPTFGGAAETSRPLTESERAAKIEQLAQFASGVAEITKVYDKDIDAKKGAGEFALARIIAKSSAPISDENAVAQVSGYNDWYVFQYASPEEAEAALKRIKLMKGVQWAEPDGIMTVDATPGNSSFKSWGFGASHVNMYEYNQWLYGQYNNDLSSMPEIIVAVIDTGADSSHSFLSGRLVPGWNFVNNTNNPQDGHSHGTHVCGTVVDGTFSNVKIMPIKVLSDSGSGSTLNVGLGMEYGSLHGAKVENLSLGGGCDGGEEHHFMAEIVDSAFDNGTTVCVAAGNESDDAVNHCPANIQRACTVAALTTSHTLCYFSNYGDLVDIAAPGDNINSSVPGGGFSTKSGTSMACPHVAAVAAQIRTAFPDMSADDVVSAIKGAAVNINVSGIGAGMLHLSANMYTLDPAANAEGQYNHFVSTGSYAWTVDGDSVVSGNAGVNNTTSVLKTELSLGFEQVLTFDYKVSSQQDHDYLRVKANGTVIFETSGEHDWQTETVTIPGSGSVALTFEFSKDSTGASGSDKAWIRNVSVLGSLSSAGNVSGGTIPFSSTGEYPWTVDHAESAAVSGNAGVDNSTSVMTASGEYKKGMILTFKYKVSSAEGDVFAFRFDGAEVFTSGTTDGYVDYEYTVPYSGMHTFSFEFIKDGSGSDGSDCAYVKHLAAYHSFESAVNGSDNFLPFDNESDYPWYPMNDYVGSSNWSEDSTTSFFTLQLPMQAGETLTFRYRASSENNYDFFRFYVDGTQQVQASGNTSWTNFTFTATTTKTYLFKWAFEKDYSAASNDDSAYVDDVVYSGSVVDHDGDANENGEVNTLDALLILRYSMGLIDESQLNLERSDVDYSGVVDSADALIVLRRSMGLNG